MPKIYKYTLALTAIFRDEAPYLREWIEFHLSLGVEFFHLFNNLSSDHFAEVLKPYIKNGTVKLTDWPIEHDAERDWCITQRLAYERALHLSRGKVKWLAILDTDEFLFPVQENSLVDVLKRFESFGGVGVNWQIFGTSHVAKIPENQLMIEMLQSKLPKNEPVNTTVKSIVRPERVIASESGHHMRYLPGYFQVNTDATPFTGPRTPYVQVDQLRINHYRSRDEHFFHARKLERLVKWWNLHPKSTWENFYNSFNQVEDAEILRFVPELKKRLQKSS